MLNLVLSFQVDFFRLENQLIDIAHLGNFLIYSLLVELNSVFGIRNVVGALSMGLERRLED